MVALEDPECKSQIEVMVSGESMCGSGELIKGPTEVDGGRIIPIHRAKRAMKAKHVDALAKHIYPLIKPILENGSDGNVLYWDFPQTLTGAAADFFLAHPFRTVACSTAAPAGGGRGGGGTLLPPSLMEHDIGACDHRYRALTIVATLRIDGFLSAHCSSGSSSSRYSGMPLMVFDKQHFYDMDTSAPALSIKAQYKWTDANGVSILRSLLPMHSQDMTLSRVQQLCQQLQVKVKRYTTAQMQAANLKTFSPCLGKGHHGQAILVCPCEEHEEQEQELVLKFCEKMDGSTVQEYKNLIHRYQACPKHVIKPVAGSYRECADYAGYLMAERGQPIERPVHTGMVKDLLNAPHALHEAGFYHGSCRLDNAVLVDGQVKWIDMRRGCWPLADDFAWDLRSLFQSITSRSPRGADIKSMAQVYGELLEQRRKDMVQDGGRLHLLDHGSRRQL